MLIHRKARKVLEASLCHCQMDDSHYNELINELTHFVKINHAIKSVYMISLSKSQSSSPVLPRVVKQVIMFMITFRIHTNELSDKAQSKLGQLVVLASSASKRVKKYELQKLGLGHTLVAYFMVQALKRSYGVDR